MGPIHQLGHMKDKLVHGLSAFLHAIIVSLTLFGQTVYSQQATASRPNIIFIMADDHAYQAISAYGSTLIQTPNIDRIGREGAIMKKGFVTNSVCSPSRAVILTGKYSHINGLRDNGTFF